VRFSFLVTLLVVLSACQPVPRPFERTPDSENQLLRLPDSQGIIVLPVADAPAETANRLAGEMVTALLDLNVPAYFGRGNRASKILVGEVIDPGREAHIAWTLYDPEGEEIGVYDQSIEGTPVDLWARADPALMAALAEHAAPRISVYVQDETEREVLPPPIYVGEVSGAPANGDKRLQAALRQGLRRLGARVAVSPGDETLFATARVRVTDLDDDRTEIAIAWAVSDPFGIEIGKIDQASPFSSSVVEERWGELAKEAGLAAAAGLMEVVSRIDWREGFIAPDPKIASEAQ